MLVDPEAVLSPLARKVHVFQLLMGSHQSKSKLKIAESYSRSEQFPDLHFPTKKGEHSPEGTSRRAYSRSGPLSHFPVSGGPQPEGAPEQRSISRRGPFPGDPGQRKETSSNLRRVLLGGVNKSIPRVHFPAGERKCPSLRPRPRRPRAPPQYWYCTQRQRDV